MLEAGQSFGHFKIIKKLGEGGMGEVYLAEDQKLNRNIALKILQPAFLDDADRLQRLIREARTAAKISHPNVMAIYDLDSARDESSGKDLRYIVMEYVSGQSLTDYLETRKPGIADSLRLAEKIAAGLAAAHKLNIVHRDIKTDNIRIDDDGDPRILDFGLAKPLDATFAGDNDDITDSLSNDLTQEGKIMGTVNYMSPEQARGEAVDSRSDVFSFGILMYRMFTGEFPFAGQEKVSILAKILESKHAPMRDKNESIPAELERIVDKCLQKNPNDRYQDTRDLVIDIRSLRRQFESSISDSSTILAGKPEGGSRSYLFRLSRPKRIAIVLVAILIPMYIIFKSGQEGPSSEIRGLQAKENAMAILGFQNKTGDADLDWLQAGLPEILLTDLAQGGAINIISRSRVLDCLGDKIENISEIEVHKKCIDAARSLGAATVLSGSFYKMGDNIRIDARLEEVESGKIILGEKVIGSDPFVLVDSLTQKIAASLNVQEVLANNRGVSEFMSSSSEAFRYYIQGMEKFSASNYDEANALFEKAIQIDSTFALPYMRIGMSYAMQGRGLQGSPYFEKAKKYENKLPVKEKSLLDIYSDLWLKVNFDAALTKMKAFASNYPDDKEGRTFYAILKYALQRDTDGAMAELDTALLLDPQYQLALMFYVELFTEQKKYDEAIAKAKLVRDYYPDSPEGYRALSDIYYLQQKLDEAMEEGRMLLQRFPDNENILGRLISIQIHKRNFDEARKFNEYIKQRHGDDPYLMVDYYYNLANFDIWKGRFTSGLGNLKKAAALAEPTGDSVLIYNQYNLLSDYFENMDMPDSALYYNKKGFDWATRFQTFDYPMLMVKMDPRKEPEARVIFEQALQNFKSRIPSELWGIGDRLKEKFDALCTSDTVKQMEATRKLVEEQNQGTTGTRLSLGKYYVFTGHYADARKELENITTPTGENQTSRAMSYMTAVYYHGRACEALGDTEAAIADYREVLKNWGQADMKLDLITDSRARLDKLMS